MKKSDMAAVALFSGAIFLMVLIAIPAFRRRTAEPRAKPTVPETRAHAENPSRSAGGETAEATGDTPGLTQAEVRAAGLSLREAMYYEKLANSRVRCGLCPRRCLINEGRRGRCGARMNLGGKLYSLVYGKPVSVAVDPIEKKPFYHYLPGTRCFSIATAGCNLRCIFCQNWEISQSLPERVGHEDIPPEKVVELAKRSESASIAYTYSEPTIFYEYMLDCAKLAREQGVKNVYHTCGYINPEPLKELCKYLDAANVDLKGFDESFYRDYSSDSRLEPVLESIKTLKQAGVWLEITNLVIPNGNDNPDMIRKMCKWIVANVGTDVPLHFSAFRPAYKLLDRPSTPVDTLLMARRIAREAGLKYVYVGNVQTKDGGTTYCPHCGRPVLDRQGFFVAMYNLKDGRCAYCNELIPGVWGQKEARRD